MATPMLRREAIKERKYRFKRKDELMQILNSKIMSQPELQPLHERMVQLLGTNSLSARDIAIIVNKCVELYLEYDNPTYQRPWRLRKNILNYINVLVEDPVVARIVKIYMEDLNEQARRKVH